MKALVISAKSTRLLLVFIKFKNNFSIKRRVKTKTKLSHLPMQSKRHQLCLKSTFSIANLMLSSFHETVIVGQKKGKKWIDLMCIIFSDFRVSFLKSCYLIVNQFGAIYLPHERFLLALVTI